MLRFSRRLGSPTRGVDSWMQTRVRKASSRAEPLGRYSEVMFEAWQRDRSSVHLSWQTYFANIEHGIEPPAEMSPALAASHSESYSKSLHAASHSESYSASHSESHSESLKTEEHMKVQLLVRAYQVRGHQLASVDPLQISAVQRPPELSPTHYGFTDSDLDRPFNLGAGILPHMLKQQMTLRQIIAALENIYCGPIGFEYGHVADRTACNWLREKIEVDTKYKYSRSQKLMILDRLMWSDHFERFVSKKYPSEKRFGLEGGESLIPGMKALIDTSVELGAQNIVMGMSHRGRLNVLSNVVRKPNESIFSEFSGTKDWSVEGSGDVKYHLTYQRPTPSGKLVNLSLVANPSHLEAVNPVVTGKVRGIQFYAGDEKQRRIAIPVLIHGDAAFAAQGIVYETLGMTDLPAYTTGGTIHLIVNNQIGFTTDPRFARSTPYCSDVAKTVSAPVFHVNGDDVEAVVYVCDLAAQWRAKFGSDVVVDLVCYRKYGHNEIDQPGFTQPRMYEKINKMVPALQKYIDILVAEGTVTEAEVEEMKTRVWNILEENYSDSKTYKGTSREWVSSTWAGFKSPSELSAETVKAVQTGIDSKLLKHIATASASYPSDFKCHPNLARVLKQRQKSIEDGDGIDWATAESMAFGGLLAEGNHVRLSGQDVERGTFSQRHALLHDQDTEAQFVPLNNLVKSGTLETQSLFTVCNSSLSEFGTLGFELGYSIVDPNQLILWEAQFGDFANNAQCIIDQFISSGEQKWLQRSGLTMLLPHGYDGQGPEHSSARLERFLQLCDEDPYNFPDPTTNTKSSASRQHQDCNIQVVYPTVPSNYFHVLRRQCHREFRKPLIVFTSKALLRHPMAKSNMDEMKAGTRFQRLIPEVMHPSPFKLETNDVYSGNNNEPRIPYSLIKNESSDDEFKLLAVDQITTLVFCSGQVYYLLSRARQLNNLQHIALVRIEQINPFPFVEVQQTIDYYKQGLREVVYAQEESFNSGAWQFVEPRIETCLRNSEWISTANGVNWQSTFDATRCTGGLRNAKLGNPGDSLRRSVRGGRLVRYAGRDISAAPATGIKKQHKFEETMVVCEALFGGVLRDVVRMDGDVPVFGK